MAQFIRPSADVTTVNVTTPCFSQVNESSPSDADFFATTSTAVVAAAVMSTTPVPTDPGVDTGWVARVRFKVLAGAEADPAIDWQLKQNGVIAITATCPDALTVGSFQTWDFSLNAGSPDLTSGDASVITDFSNLDITVARSVLGADAKNVQFSWVELELPDVAETWWVGSAPFTEWYKKSATQPSNFTLTFPVWEDGTYYPAGTVITWSATTAPDDEGWWFSVDENFAGAATIITNSRPKNPRGFVEVNSFATGTNFPYSSFPGVCATFNNKLIYTPEGYTVGTDKPTLRVFDGTFDREICKVPVTAAGAVPKAIMSILAANGTIYISTLDSGTTSANFAGRVFELNFETGILTPIGLATTFSSGHVPYALAWHNGRLFVGTSTSDPSEEGKIYFFRPDQDTDWTLEHTLAVGCVSSMVSFEGLLYVGCTAPAGTFARVMVRQTDNSYAVSLTSSGGAAAANNGFPSMVEFEGSLYAGYWNDDATEVAKIYTTPSGAGPWTTAYTGSGTTIVPYVALAIDAEVIYAIGGGTGRDAVLVTSTDGSSWTDRTAFLSQSDTASTGLPAYGQVSL